MKFCLGHSHLWLTVTIFSGSLKSILLRYAALKDEEGWRSGIGLVLTCEFHNSHSCTSKPPFES